MNFLIWKTKNSEDVSNTDSCPSDLSQSAAVILSAKAIFPKGMNPNDK